MRVWVVNCHLSCRKKESLLEATDTPLPDIICASETWLTNNVSNSEFIANFDVYMNDGPDGYGGVLNERYHS